MTQQRFQLEDHDSEIPTALTVVVKIKLRDREQQEFTKRGRVTRLDGGRCRRSPK